MSCWDELEIDATEDIKLIKQAYARKLKTIDRQTEIDAFQRLRAAYDQARSQVTSASPAFDPPANAPPTSFTPEMSKADHFSPDLTSSVETTVESSNIQNTVSAQSDVLTGEEGSGSSGKSDGGASYTESVPEDATPVWQQVDDYLKQVDELLKNDDLKYNMDAWEPLWRHDAFDSLRTKELLYGELFAYFIQSTPSVDAVTAGDNFMPEFVLPRYDAIFSWHADELRLAERFEEEDVDRLLLLCSDDRIQSQLQSAEQGTSKVGKVYLWATVLIIAAMYIKSRYF